MRPCWVCLVDARLPQNKRVLHITHRDVLRTLSDISYAAFCEKCRNTEFFWPVFSYVRNEYRDLRSKSLYLVRIQENTDQKMLRIWGTFHAVKEFWISLWLNSYVWIYKKFLNLSCENVNKFEFTVKVNAQKPPYFLSISSTLWWFSWLN